MFKQSTTKIYLDGISKYYTSRRYIPLKFTVIYMTLAMAVDALDGLRSLTFGSTENFWEVAGHYQKIKKLFYERAPPGNIPARSISDLRNEKWSKSRILGIMDLAAVQP